MSGYNTILFEIHSTYTSLAPFLAALNLHLILKVLGCGTTRTDPQRHVSKFVNAVELRTR